MAFTTIAKSSDHFDCPTWTGSSSTTTITGMGFKPDILLIKRYDGNGLPKLNNSTLGINSNYDPSQQGTNDTTAYVASYTSDGFTLTGNINDTNFANQNYLSACFKCNGGTTSANSDGATASTVQANTSSGVSVVTYTGTGSATTIGHGLGVAPKIIITKSLTTAAFAGFGNGSTNFLADPWTDYVQFAQTATTLADLDTLWNDTAPTTTVFSVKSATQTNKSSDSYVAYCFAEVQGFSKFGYYSGRGNIRGTKVYCGFRPKFVMIKNIDASEDWTGKASGLTGDGFGGGDRQSSFYFNRQESLTNATVQFESNGFRLASTDGKVNGLNVKYLYMAFAEMPMVGTNGTIALAT
jgi:hypothetical protein